MLIKDFKMMLNFNFLITDLVESQFSCSVASGKALISHFPSPTRELLSQPNKRADPGWDIKAKQSCLLRCF